MGRRNWAKKTNQSFDILGVSRVLVDAFSSDSTDDVQERGRAWAGAKPLPIAKAARSAIARASELFKLCGFVGPSCTDLANPSAAGWKMAWVDMKKDGTIYSVAFTAATVVGPWRVVVSEDHGVRSITGSFPILGDGFVIPLPGDSGELVRKIDEFERKEEASRRLQHWGELLRGTRSAERLIQLWEACNDDLDLAEALNQQAGESWQEWRKRAFAAVRCVSTDQWLQVPVSEVLFTHKSIAAVFRHGHVGEDVEALVNDLRNGLVDPLAHEDLLLDVVRYRGRLHSLNNRRLWALQQHQLLLLNTDAVVYVQVRVLPWSKPRTLTRFLLAFDACTDGESVRVRTSTGAPPSGVVANTLRDAALRTPVAQQSAKESERRMLKSRQVPGVQEGSFSGSATHGSSAAKLGKVLLRGESFQDWKQAKKRIQSIMIARSDGQELPPDEVRLLLDVFAYHPNTGKLKLLPRVKTVTVGCSEKYPDRPCFWMWLDNGKGLDISVNKCFDNWDLKDKQANKEAQREVLGGQRFRGWLLEWHASSDQKSYGAVQLSDHVVINGHKIAPAGQKLYVQFVDLAPDLITFAASSKSARARSRQKRTPHAVYQMTLSFQVYRWRSNGKLGCLDVRSAES
ncbi:unnamed protein product [Polarella glacialis]|uniref:Uncharacterized protein n=1 Tax=Polarella glacialis TaxID=89957 RepID=A0A813KVR1_POLGL|nr:unnamed protein product [Polarella glacialis]